MSTTAELAADALRQLRRLPPRPSDNRAFGNRASLTSETPEESSHPALSTPELPEALPADEDSPFGVFGKMREVVHVLKPECISVMAAALAAQSRLYPVQHPAFRATVKRLAGTNPNWFETYQIVEAFDSSLMLPGQQRLVLRMVADPQVIPDSPPLVIEQALLRATALHPTASVWYAEPVFGVGVGTNGLPIPMTEQAFNAEADSRLEKALKIAKDYGWMFRNNIRLRAAAHFLLTLPKRIYLGFSLAFERQLAERLAEQQTAQEVITYYRTGQHSCRGAADRLETLSRLERLYVGLVGEVPAVDMMIFSTAAAVALSMTTIDPLLFVELPGEKGQLRFVGHWFWEHVDGKRVLHLHM